jgi:hypothetical protein
MFSVYGKAGRMFRGSMEELRKIGPTSALARTHRVAGVGREAADSFVAQLAWAAQGGSGGHGGKDIAAQPDLAHREAMAAYTQAASNQPPRHPLKLVQDIMNPGAISLGQDATVVQA